MTAENFPPVMAEIFRHEGGFVDHPRDPGGATNMGITIGTLHEWRGRPVTKDEVRALTIEEARAIYRARYWDRVKGDDLPPGLDLVAMDAAVNSGVGRGIRWLQHGVSATRDGIIGPRTVAAAWASGEDGITRACDARIQFLRALGHWDTFGRGWSRRVQSVRNVALTMWRERGTDGTA